MKAFNKVIVAIIITLTMILGVATPAYCKPYIRTGVITSVDYKINEWEVTDTTENIWTFSDGEDLITNDIVLMEMDDNNTPVIYDDLITYVYCIGYYE